MTTTETVRHLENLLLSHEITKALKAQVSIVLSRENGVWAGTFSTADRLEMIPLPYTSSMPYGIVAAEMADRFPSAAIVVRLS